MAEHRRWTDDLPADLMSEIVRLFPCAKDRRTITTVCRTWRARAQIPPPPPALPWLLLPSAGSTPVHCFLSDFRVRHDIGAPPHGARYFGSHDGAWLFLAYQTRRHELLNLRDNSSYALPDLVRQQQNDRDMVILAATLVPAGWPDNPALRRLAFWRMRSLSAKPDWLPPVDFEVEDVVYHGVAFHFLTRGEHIRVCEPVLGEGGRMLLLPELKFLQPEGRNYDGLVVRARYLVASGGELLMVGVPGPAQIPQSDDDDEEDEDQDMDIEQEVDDEDDQVAEVDDQGEEVEYTWCWGELDTLGAVRCSRSYEVAQYPGFKAGIYFLDDRSFYDEGMMFRGVNEKQYPCNDNGKWSEGPPPGIKGYAPQDSSNNCSPPAWLLP
uniref:KIB1-4 beta-propeller domain-containing protein n=1 Tax=Setaria viridis TaxID=4556 RepID=A0A4U6VBE2_SETVI|nr:hypothetical protein SEVIR_3G142200v2 [Setaria viridis]